MPSIANLSPSELHALADERFTAHAEAVRHLEAAGHRQGRYDEARTMAEAGHGVARRYIETYDAWQELPGNVRAAAAIRAAQARAGGRRER